MQRDKEIKGRVSIITMLVTSTENADGDRESKDGSGHVHGGSVAPVNSNRKRACSAPHHSTTPATSTENANGAPCR